MNWNIFWGLYTLAFAVATLLVWYFLYYRKKHYTELCSVKTTGTVVLLLGLTFLAAALFILFGPAITMH